MGSGNEATVPHPQWSRSQTLAKKWKGLVNELGGSACQHVDHIPWNIEMTKMVSLVEHFVRIVLLVLLLSRVAKFIVLTNYEGCRSTSRWQSQMLTPCIDPPVNNPMVHLHLCARCPANARAGATIPVGQVSTGPLFFAKCFNSNLGDYDVRGSIDE